jgi:general secretion pathway protein B
MSYILDALRKSEQERQIAAGGSAGMLYPSTPEHRPGIGRKVTLLGAAILIVTLSLNWWSLSRMAPPAKALPAAATPPAVTVQNTPAASVPVNIPSVPTSPKQSAGPVAAVSPPQPTSKPTVGAPPSPIAPPEKPLRIAPKEPAPAPLAAPAPKSESASDAPKGLPPISVSGYVKDETGGNLAIINDKLVREGEEVSPGLRLERIDGENAFFNYKGQRFRR